MPGLRRAVERLATAMLLLGGMGMLAAMFLGTADVVGTQFVGWPVPGTLELTESMMVLIVFGALAYTQIRRGHIRVELLYARVGPRARAAMDALGHVAALLFFGLLLWQAVGEAILSWRIGEATVGLVRFPLYPARWTFVVGTGLLLAQLTLDFVLEVQRLSGRVPFESPEAAPALPEILTQQVNQADET